MEILRELLIKVAETENKECAQGFYKKYFMQILEHVLSVVTDHNQVPFIGLFVFLKKILSNKILRFNKSF